MKEKSVRKKISKHYVRFDGTTWPALDVSTHDADSLQWLCRYGRDNLTTENLLVIASIIAAYNHLIGMPQARRNEVCKSIRDLSKGL